MRVYCHLASGESQKSATFFSEQNLTTFHHVAHCCKTQPHIERHGFVECCSHNIWPKIFGHYSTDGARTVVLLELSTSRGDMTTCFVHSHYPRGFPVQIDVPCQHSPGDYVEASAPACPDKYALTMHEIWTEGKPFPGLHCPKSLVAVLVVHGPNVPPIGVHAACFVSDSCAKLNGGSSSRDREIHTQRLCSKEQ